MANPQKNFGQENIKAGDNTKFIGHELMILNLPPVDIDSDEEVEERLQLYFALCMQHDMKPTVSGMANALKVSRFTLAKWKDGERRGKTDNRPAIIEKYYNLLQSLYEDNMMNGKVNPVTGIFMGKNHFGYTDKQEVVLKAKQQFEDVVNPDEVRQKYLESAGLALPENTDSNEGDSEN